MHKKASLLIKFAVVAIVSLVVVANADAKDKLLAHSTAPQKSKKHPSVRHGASILLRAPEAQVKDAPPVVVPADPDKALPWRPMKPDARATDNLPIPVV